MFIDDDEEEVMTTKENTKAAKTTSAQGKRYVFLYTFVLIYSAGNVRPGKREFDRHSGTGRGYVFIG